MLFAALSLAILTSASPAEAEHSVYDRAVALGALVNQVGIVETARQCKDELDRSIIEVVAPLYRGEGGEEALQILEERWGPMPSSDYVISPSTSEGEAAPLLFSTPRTYAQTAYHVEFINDSELLLSEVVSFYRDKRGVTVWPPVRAVDLPAGHGAILNLGVCQMMRDYTLAAYIHGRPDPIARIPQQGTLTPALVSKLHPNDDNPCADSWRFAPN